MKKNITLLFFIVLASPSFSQLKLKEANKQHWNGGIQGYYGTNYSATFKYCSKDSLTIDSLYLIGKGYAVLPSSNDMGQPHWFQSIENKKKVIHFFFKEAFIPCTIPDFGADTTQLKLDNTKIPSFTGEALLIYSIKGKKKKLVINKFAVLETINYP